MKGLLCFAALSVAPAWAVLVSPEDRDEVEFIDFAATRPIDISRVDVNRQTLGYGPAEVVFGLERDWNGDGVPERLVVSAESLCGSGGCSYHLYDGKSGHLVGEFFGRPLFVHSRCINGWPVVSVYGHSSSESGSYVGTVFDGSKYTEVFATHLSGESVKQLFEDMIKRRHGAPVPQVGQAPNPSVKGTSCAKAQAAPYVER